MKDTCQTCGEPVEVVASEEGTSHYESVAAKRIGELEAALREAAVRLRQAAEELGNTEEPRQSTDIIQAELDDGAYRARAALEPAPSESEGKR